MSIDDARGDLFELLSQPLAVVAVVLLAGIHAAVWMLVFERMGYPPVLSALLFIPPLTFFMPLALALTRWPAPETSRFATRFRKLQTRPVQRFVGRARPASPMPPPESFVGRRPVSLAADGLPRARISLGPSQEDTLFRPHDSAPVFHQQPPWGQ